MLFLSISQFILKALPDSFRTHPIESIIFFILLSFPTWVDWRADSGTDDLKQFT